MVIRSIAAFLAVAFFQLSSPARAEEPRLRDAPPEYLSALRNAVAAFTERDFDKTIKLIDEAEAMRPPNPITLNTRGAVLIEQKKFAEGEAYCRKALAIDPQFYPARFNLCEVPLVQKRYSEARAMFQTLLDENPKDELAQFRVLLTYLLEKKDEDARRVLDAIPFPGSTCAYYYAHAAWEFAHGNTTEGEKWVTRGNWVFKPEITTNFSQPFVELGWLKSEPGPSAALPDLLTPTSEPKVPLQLENQPPIGASRLGR